MSAAEIIEQIKALPPAEVAVVREFLAETASPTVDFDRIAERVFSKHDRVLRELAK